MAGLLKKKRRFTYNKFKLDDGTKVRVQLVEEELRAEIWSLARTRKMDITCGCGERSTLLGGCHWSGWMQHVCDVCDRAFWYSHDGWISSTEPEGE